MRLILIACFTLIFSTSSFATGNDFLPKCKVAVNVMDNGVEGAAYEDMINLTSCTSTIRGARDMNSIYEQVNMPTLFCIPNSVQQGQLIRVAINYMESNPAELHNPFVFLLGLAFNDAYPCSET